MPEDPTDPPGIDELIVENLGIIAHARIEPGRGLVAFTGETGAGKTLLLGALRLLLGAQGRRDQVGPDGDEAVVQGRFALAAGEVMAVRRLSAQGRSHAYLDGLMASVGTLTERLAGLVELTSQHDHVLVGRPDHIREMVDFAAGVEGARERAAYAEAWAIANELERRLAALGGDRRGVERELATARHHADDIGAAGFAPGDDLVLERSATRLRNARAILDELDGAAVALSESGVERHLDAALRALTRAASHDPELAELVPQAVELTALSNELRTDVARAASGLDDDPARLDQVEARLASLGDLRRRYGDTLDEVLAFAVSEGARAVELEGLLASADDLDRDLATARDTLDAAGSRLRDVRRHAADLIAEQAQEHLGELGFDDPVVSFISTPAPPGPDGADRMELRFASDRSLEPGPVSRVASGGELSRLVLALRLAAGGDAIPVFAFDEIDAGVGGTVALELGRKLARLSAGRQVLCVTHLPQVAAHADRHYVVERTAATTAVRLLDEHGRVEELTRMLAGMPDSEAGRRHAAELLATARRP